MDIIDDKSQAISILSNYSERIHEAFGLYNDALLAMKMFKSFFEVGLKKNFEGEGGSGTKETFDDIKKSKVVYVSSDKSSSEQRQNPLHGTTVEDILIRNESGGKNEKTFSRLLLITIYQYWEDDCRGEIAKICKKEKDDITSDVLGDVRLLRNSVIHNKSIAKEDISKCRVFKYFSPGDEIYLDRDQARNIVHSVLRDLNDIGKRYCQVDHNFSELMDVKFR